MLGREDDSGKASRWQRSAQGTIAPMILAAIGSLAACAAHGQLAVERITTAPTGFNYPLAAVSAPGQPSTLYVVQKGGAIRSIDVNSPTATPQPFLTLDDAIFPGSNLYSAGGLSGLLGLAFHPRYETNGLFYAYYTANGNREFRLDQFKASNGVVQAGVRRNVLTIPSSSTGSENNLHLRHAGGWVGFRPTTTSELTITVGDGPYVFVGTPDPENNAQNTGNLLGKVLRIDVGADGLDFHDPAATYAIPAGNMTVNPNGNLSNPAPPSLAVRPEIYAYGLRNPWRGSFDRQTGDFYVGDVGQWTQEEINVIPAGRSNTAVLDQKPGSTNGINFGWRVREGTAANPEDGGSDQLRNDNVEPVFAYPHDPPTSGTTPLLTGLSVTGGYVYRGPAFPDYGGDLSGTYLFADYQTNKVASFRYDVQAGLWTDFRDRTAELSTSLPSGMQLGGIASFAEDGNGNLYALSLSSGDVFRFVPVPEPSGWVAGIVAATTALGGHGLRRRWSRSVTRGTDHPRPRGVWRACITRRRDPARLHGSTVEGGSTAGDAEHRFV